MNNQPRAHKEKGESLDLTREQYNELRAQYYNEVLMPEFEACLIAAENHVRLVCSFIALLLLPRATTRVCLCVRTHLEKISTMTSSAGS